MHHFRIIVFVFLLGKIPNSSGNDFEIISNYLKETRPDFCVFLTCWTQNDKAKMQKIITNEFFSLRTTYIKIEDGILSKINTSTYEKITFILDLQCENYEKILQQAIILNKFEFLYSWLLLNTSKYLPKHQIRDVFKEIKTRMDMDVIVVTKNISKIDIFEVYNPGIKVGLRINKMDGFLRNISYYMARKDMTGVLIRSSNVVHYPYKTSFHEYMTDPSLRRYDIYSKFHYQLFLALEEIHNYHHNMTLCYSWFGNTSSGQDGGMAKLLYDDIIDLSSAGGIIRLLGSDRIDYYDYIMPYYKFRSCFFFRNPGVVKPNFYEVLKPFAKNTWYVSLVTSMLVCTCIDIANVVGNRIFREKIWAFSVFVAIAAFSQQGISEVPSNFAARILYLNLFIMSMLLFNYYTSSLVSSLISTTPEVFTTIRELYESTLKVGIEPIPYTITYMLDESKRNHYLNLLNETKIYGKHPPNFFAVDEGFNKVKDGGFAYHTEAITAYPIISDTFEQDAICDLVEINFLIGDTSLMMGKRRQYRKMFQISLRKMWERGIMRKLYITWVGGKPDCLSSTRIISVGKNDLFLLYFIFFVGVICSLVVLLGEFTWYKIKHTEIPTETVYPFMN